MEYLIAYAHRLPNVDWDHVGVVGHSGGAHAVLTLRAHQDAPVDAVVSLDTTQDYYSLPDPRWDRLTTVVTDNRRNVRSPLLMVAKPHAFFQMADSLRFCRRYYLTIKDLNHDEFISQGIIRAQRQFKLQFADAGSRKATSHEGQEDAKAHLQTVERDYESLCIYVLNFLKASLKADAEAEQFLSKAYRLNELGGANPHVEYVPKGVNGPKPYQKTDPLPPTPRQVRVFLQEHGVAKTLDLLKLVRRDHPGSPIFHLIFEFALVCEILDQGQDQDAIKLYKYFCTVAPKLTGYPAALGDRYSRMGYLKMAIRYYKKALVLEPARSDIANKLRKAQNDYNKSKHNVSKP